MRKRMIILLILLMTVIPVTGMKVIYDHRRLVGGATQLTTDTHYDRNPSFFKASGGKYWLFFVKSHTDYNGYGCDETGGPMNCDSDSYDVYYMTSTDQGDTWTTPAKIPLASTNQRGMAAFQDSIGKIWVFVSAPGGDGKIHYYTYNGVTWSGPTDVMVGASTVSGSHVDAFQATDGKIWVFYEGSSPAIIYGIYSSDDGSTWSSPVQISETGKHGGIPKAMQAASGNLSVVWAGWTEHGIWYSTSSSGTIWSTPEQLAVTPYIDADPVLYQDSSGKYWLFFAPWDEMTNSQWIESMYSLDGITWSLPVKLTDGGYGTDSFCPPNGGCPGVEYWWDMWPEVFRTTSGNLLIFYTSEMSKGSYERGSGNIWMFKVVIPLEQRIDEHEGRLVSLENWRVKIETEIMSIWIKLEELQSFVRSVFSCTMSTFNPLYLCLSGEQPETWEDHCPNQVCEPEKGETETSCPQDCEVEQAPTGEVFITRGWKVTCPETYQGQEIQQCRIEVYQGTRKLAESFLDTGESKQVNWRRGYSLKLFGILMVS